MSVSTADLRSGCEKAIQWLVNSNIRAPDGGYYSIYHPKTRQYENWYANRTCLLSTSGALMVLDSVGYGDLAVRSAEHICQLGMNPDSRFGGGLLSGKGSQTILANWMSTAIIALLRIYQTSRSDKFLQVAIKAGKFICERMQNEDGSINQRLCVNGRPNNLSRLFLPRQIWLANSVEALVRLYKVTGEECFKVSADRFINWLVKQQRRDGSFPMYQHSVMSRVAVGLYQLSLAEILYGCRQGHPASHTQSIKALMAVGRSHEGALSTQWLSQRMSPNGLFYQFYFRDGSHSVEEDVMPTAHFGLVLLEHPELGASKELLMKIASGLIYAQIKSGDPNADGALRGLPLHAALGEDAYCWDTIHSILFWQGLLRENNL